MSRGDLLLRWASCYRELRTARVQAAAQRLCAPPVVMTRDDPRRVQYLRAAKRLMWNLVRIGHLEELSADRLRTVPPTLVVQGGNRFLVTGARSESLLYKLAIAAGAEVLPFASQHEGPAVWQVVDTQDAVFTAADALGFTVRRDRGADLLASLPCLIDTLAGAPSEGIPDKTERWVPDAPIRRQWLRTAADGHPPCLYRTIQKPRQWYFRPDEATPPIRLNTPERRVAAAWLLIRSKVQLEFSQEARILSVPAIGFRLPLLVDRALILASGRLPQWHSRHWCYFNIDCERSQHFARILGARMKVIT